MAFLLYNKLLLRLLVILSGIAVGAATYYYVTLSGQKLPEHGVTDALAIISFLIAGWLVMAIAEVIDNHYARVFGCLCIGLGGYMSFPWVFRTDGPKLAELPGGAEGMRIVTLGFWAAIGLAAVMLVLLVWRLILDRVTYGRRPRAVARDDTALGQRPAGMGEPQRSPELPPIPIDASPLAVGSTPAGEAPATPAAPREPAPVSKLVGIGGVYLGTEFALAPGDHLLGRAEAEFLLANDNQVSRRHAQLSVTPDGIATITDLGSTNGTYLNDSRVTSVALAPGDILRIGTSLFKAEA